MAHAMYSKWQGTYVGGSVVIIIQQLCHHGIRDYGQQWKQNDFDQGKDGS
jgi:hypothetical protein